MLNARLCAQPSSDLKNPTEDEIVVTPDKIIRHPNYDGGSLEHDVCLLYIKKGLVLDEDTSPVCVPKQFNGKNGVETGTNCFVGGWGRTSENGAAAQVLQVLTA